MIAARAASALAWLWLGLLIGVSFLATPVKFVVMDLTLPVALQVGAATFALFTKVEWALAALALAIGAAGRGQSRAFLALAAALAVVVTVQAIWLLPALDARVAEIVAGNAPAPSPHHAFYAGLELFKACLLLGVALLAEFSRKRRAGA